MRELTTHAVIINDNPLWRMPEFFYKHLLALVGTVRDPVYTAGHDVNLTPMLI